MWCGGMSHVGGDVSLNTLFPAPWNAPSPKVMVTPPMTFTGLSKCRRTTPIYRLVLGYRKNAVNKKGG